MFTTRKQTKEQFRCQKFCKLAKDIYAKYKIDVTFCVNIAAFWTHDLNNNNNNKNNVKKA